MQAALVAMVDESERLKHEQEKIMVRVRPLVLVSSLKQTVNISVVISTPIILLHNLCRLEEHAGRGLEETLLPQHCKPGGEGMQPGYCTSHSWRP